MANARRDAGQAAVVVMLVVGAVFAASAAALGAVGADMVDRTRAQTAADAAALAELVRGPGAGDAIAARHGATVVSWHRAADGRVVTVVVRVGDATATARATDRPGGP